MVDVKQIELLLHLNFLTYGEYHIDPDTGVINVKGDVLLKQNMEEMPVQFGTVTDVFDCRHMQLTTLKGAPIKVRDFHCNHNQLKNLNHAPKHVKGFFIVNNNKLTTLVGAPLHVGGSFEAYTNPLRSLDGLPESSMRVEITYHKKLALLRLLMHQDFFVWACPAVVRDILKKYKGQGRSGALLAAAELIRAGHAENARW